MLESNTSDMSLSDCSPTLRADQSHVTILFIAFLRPYRPTCCWSYPFGRLHGCLCDNLSLFDVISFHRNGAYKLIAADNLFFDNEEVRVVARKCLSIAKCVC